MWFYCIGSVMLNEWNSIIIISNNCFASSIKIYNKKNLINTPPIWSVYQAHVRWNKESLIYFFYSNKIVAKQPPINSRDLMPRNLFICTEIIINAGSRDIISQNVSILNQYIHIYWDIITFSKDAITAMKGKIFDINFLFKTCAKECG